MRGPSIGPFFLLLALPLALATREASVKAKVSSPVASVSLAASGGGNSPSRLTAEARLEVLKIIQEVLDSRAPAPSPEAPIEPPKDDQKGIQASQADITAALQAAPVSLDSIAQAIRNAPFGQLIYAAPAHAEAPASQPPKPAGEQLADAAQEASETAAAEKPAGEEADEKEKPAVKEVPAESPAPADNVQHPWWAGQTIQHVSKEAGKEGAAASSDIASLKDLHGKSDSELLELFGKGEPDVPGNLPNSTGKFTFCTGEPLYNALTEAGWPHGPWPKGEKNPINNLLARIWRGKVFYSNPKTNATNLWNLVWTNSTVAMVANISVANPGLTADGKASAVIDYGKTENILFRAIREEVRRVGPSVWLGRAWFSDPVKNYDPDHPRPIQGAISQATKPLANATLLALSEAIGLQGANANEATSGGNYTTPGEPIAINYFAMDCQQDAVPKLFYTKSAETQAFLSSRRGFNDPFYKLPALNAKAANKSVEEWIKEAPVSTSGPDGEPFILYPWKFSDVGPIGYIKMPAHTFEPVFGAFWLYDYRKNAAQLEQRDPATIDQQEHIEFPIREAAQHVVEPVMDPIAFGLGQLPNQLPSPFHTQGALNLPTRAP